MKKFGRRINTAYLCLIINAHTNAKKMTAIILVFQVLCGVGLAKQIPANWVYDLMEKSTIAKAVWIFIKIIAFILGFACGKFVLIICAALIIYYAITKKS